MYQFCARVNIQADKPAPVKLSANIEVRSESLFHALHCLTTRRRSVPPHSMYACSCWRKTMACITQPGKFKGGRCDFLYWGVLSCIWVTSICSVIILLFCLCCKLLSKDYSRCVLFIYLFALLLECLVYLCSFNWYVTHSYILKYCVLFNVHNKYIFFSIFSVGKRLTEHNSIVYFGALIPRKGSS